MGRIIVAIKKLFRIRPIGFWPGFIVGLAYFSYIFSWIWSVYPPNSFGIADGFLGEFLVAFVFIITVLGMAFFWGLFSFFSQRITLKRYLQPFYLASIFVLAEYLRSWGLGLIWVGSGSFLGPQWTLGNPAYLFSFLPWVLKTSSIWGIYGLDFLIIFLLSALIIVFKEKGNGRSVILGEILLILGVFLIATSFSTGNQSGSPLTVSVIQTKNLSKTNYTPKELLDDFSQQDALLKSAAKYSDIVVFTESANFSQTLADFLSPALVQKYFNNLADKNILIVDSDRVLEPSGLKSKVILIDSKNGVTGTYDKKLLTPIGEFLPYVLKIPLSIFESFRKFSLEFPEFTPGFGGNIIAYQDSNIKILACSDIMSPSIGQEGTFDFMLDLSSLGLFKGNNRIANEMVAAAQFRAAENGKYMVLASNYGRSYIINPQGNITESTSSSGYQILTGSVVPNQERTWYNKLGDWPILLLSVVFFSFGLISKKCPKKLS